MLLRNRLQRPREIIRRIQQTLREGGDRVGLGVVNVTPCDPTDVLLFGEGAEELVVELGDLGLEFLYLRLFGGFGVGVGRWFGGVVVGVGRWGLGGGGFVFGAAHRPVRCGCVGVASVTGDDSDRGVVISGGVLLVQEVGELAVTDWCGGGGGGERTMLPKHCLYGTLEFRASVEVARCDRRYR